MNRMISPFPYFGGKRVVADVVWRRFGDVPNYVEPFFGSGAVLLARPNWTPEACKIETVNDADGFVSNFWRALQHDPEQLRHWADWPVNENDLHARHSWLVNRKADITRKLEGDPDYYDAKVAGWWLWGICCWIGSGWCSGDGPWQSVNGELVKTDDSAGRGVNRQLVYLRSAGQGVNRKLTGGSDGDGGNGLEAWIRALAARLERVRVCSGDWARVCGPTPTEKNGLTGVFFDPPYSELATRTSDLYSTDSESVAHDVREWCIQQAHNPLIRIALCGYTGEHDNLSEYGFTPHFWKAKGGYGNQSDDEETNGRANSEREVIWFSENCIPEVEGEKQLSFM